MMTIIGHCTCNSPNCRYCGLGTYVYPNGIASTAQTIYLGHVAEVWAVAVGYGLVLFRSEIEALRYAVGRGVEPFRVEFGKPIRLISDEEQAAAMAEDQDEDAAIANEVG